VRSSISGSSPANGNLRNPQAFDLIDQLFAASLIGEMSIDPTGYRQAYERSSPPMGFSKKPLALTARYKRSRPGGRGV